MSESFIWLIITIIASICISWGLCELLFTYTRIYTVKHYSKSIKRGFIVFIIGLVLIILESVILINILVWSGKI